MSSVSQGTSVRRTSVRLVKTGQILRIRPPVRCLESLFRPAVKSVIGDPDFGPVVGQGNYPFAERIDGSESDGIPAEWRTFAGLKPLVVESLERSGYRVDVSGCVVPPMIEPDCGAFAGEIIDRSILDFIQQHDRGVIRYDAAKVSPGRLIRQAAMAWPNEKIAVWANRIHDTHKVANDIGIGVPVSLHHSKRFDRPERVAVATWHYASDKCTEHRRRHMVFAVDPHGLLSLDDAYAIGESDRARMYAFIADDVHLSPRDERYVRAVFGFYDIFIPCHGFRPKTIRVAMPIIKGKIDLPVFSEAEPLKRQGVWHNPEWNTRVATLADLLANGGDRAAIREAFPDLPRKVTMSSMQRIVLLTENVEHALELSRLLPGWSIITGENVYQEGLTPGQNKLLQIGCDQFELGETGRAIVTRAGLSRIVGCDVLIRAEGGTTSLPRDLRLLYSQYANKPMTIIDFFDRQHPRLFSWSQNRRNQYLAAGWKVLGYRGPPNPYETAWKSIGRRK